MIERDEIMGKAEEFGIHPSNVQRDYVFGWLLAGLYAESPLAGSLTVKGGNALRKGYFPLTRFSDDLDFSTPNGLDGDRLVTDFNEICRFAEARAGIRFDTSRSRIVDVHSVEGEPSRQVCKLALYFQDFSGDAAQIVLKVRLDVTEYDARPFSGGSRGAAPRPRRVRPSPRYTVQCPYCGKRFTRKTPSTRLNKHQDRSGNPCYGRAGYRVY